MQAYRWTAERVLRELNSAPGGLSRKQAAARLAKHGENRLARKKGDSLWRRFMLQLSDPMILVLLAAAAGIGILALGPALLECVLHSRVGEDIQDSNSDRLQFLARAADDFLRHPVFGIGLCSTRNADVFTGVEGSMVFYHNSLAQVMGSMGLVGIVAYGRLLHDRIALLRQGSRDPFVRILTLSYLGMFLISLCNPGEFCPFPNAALMVMVFAQAEEAVGDVAVPVRQLLARHLGAPAGFLQF